MNNPLVTVIIPTYNNAPFIGEAIESVLAQTYKNIEIIVVDDGSKDNTSEVIKSFLNRITYLQKPNGGPASARNVGLREAKGEFLAFLDSDDVWFPSKLEKQLAAMQKDPAVGLVSCSEYHIGKNGEVIGNLEYKNYTNKQDFINIMLLKNKVGGGSSSLIRKEILPAIGYFNEQLRGTEDWDMWLRISLQYDVYFVPEFLIKTRILSHSVSAAPNAVQMLNNEIKLLDQLFADPRYTFNPSQRSKSYSYRYFVAAKTYKGIRSFKKAGQYLAKSLKLYPLHLFNLEFIKVSLIIIGGLVNNSKANPATT